MKQIFDTHAHYDDEAFDTDREILLDKLPKVGVERVVNIGASIDSCKKTIQLMDQYSFIYGALGVHPSEVAELNMEKLLWLKEQCNHKKCVAVGEIGLDYHWDEPARALQKEWFQKQLELARELSLPVVIHSRDAAQDTIDVMQKCHAQEIGGVIHCYSFSKETAKIFLKMGFYFGIGGVLTFKNSKKLKEAVEYIPMESIVLETDSPYLAPEPFRGKRNDSQNLTYVVEALSQIKGISTQEVCRITWENANKLYRMQG